MTIVNVFIDFVKFLDLKVAIWMRLVRLIEEKVIYGFGREPGSTTKIKHIITKQTKKKKLDLGGPGPLGPLPRSVPDIHTKHVC